MAFSKLPQDLWQLPNREVFHDADPQRARQSPAMELRARGLVKLDHASGVAEQDLAFRRELDRLGRAPQDLAAIDFLDPGDVKAPRRLGAVQRPGRAAYWKNRSTAEDLLVCDRISISFSISGLVEIFA